MFVGPGDICVVNIKTDIEIIIDIVYISFKFNPFVICMNYIN